MNECYLVAVDVGNSRVKAGLMVLSPTPGAPPEKPADRLPGVHDVVRVPIEPEMDWSVLKDWLLSSGLLNIPWWLAGVNPPVLDSLQGWLRRKHFFFRVLDDAAALPLQIDLPQPESAGIDRLLAAVAANAVRPAGSPTIVIDAGSAMTVDALSAEGTFLGGAILPGMALAALALHEFTFALPLVNADRLTSSAPPTPLGTNTADALAAGLYWGSVGGVRELIQRITAQLGWSDPLLVVTGGDGALLAQQLGSTTLSLPNLTLQGIALAAAAMDE